MKVTLLLCHFYKPFVEMREKLLKEAVGLGFCPDAGQPHLFDQTILEYAKGSFDPAFGLRRVSMNHFYP